MMSNGLQFKLCIICFEVVKCNQKGFLCNHCLCWIHEKCARFTKNLRILEVTMNLGSAAHV